MNFNKNYATNESIKIIGSLAKVCAALGGELSKQLYNLFLEGRYKEIAEFTFDYSLDTTRDDFLYSRQIQGFFAKQNFLDFGVDKEKVAFSSFLASEEKCRRTNINLDTSSHKSDVSAVFHHAIRKIDRILGDVPSYDKLPFSFGPGATTSVKRARSNPRVKLEAPLECNTNLIPIVRDLLNEVPNWTASKVVDNNLQLQVVPSKLVFVPKNSRTHRSIGIEPTLTGFFQQGVGKYLKKRLLGAGIDLSDQTRNKRLACKGSIDGSLATIDLSNASDTIASGLVWMLLPYDWCVLLDHLRSENIQYKDVIYKLNKFSSMGNSYTFELESLIFYALADSCCQVLQVDRRDISVYGDDIIVPTSAAAFVVEVLEYCGFSVNLEKSFTEGPFRESCGGDYLNGFDIRPFYLKDQISVRTLYLMHNWFIRHGEFQLAKTVLSAIPNHIRLFGPDGYGDGHLIGSYQLRLNRKMRRLGYGGGFFDSFSAIKRTLKLPDNRDFVYPTYSIYILDSALTTESRDHDTIPGETGYRKISIYTFRTGVFT